VIHSAMMASPSSAGAAAAERLRNPATRLAELDAMEQAPPVATADAAAAAAALMELRALDVEDVPREVFERVRH
jgi:hypothetical protein